MNHTAELPDPGLLELRALDGKKLQLLQILEWLEANDPKFADLLPASNESSVPSTRVLDWLRTFNPEKDLLDNVWLKRATNSRDFRLLIKRIKKEPPYEEYFATVIAKRGDGYDSKMEDMDKSDEMDVEVEADSLFLEDEGLAYRVLGIKSPFKCMDCTMTKCTPIEPAIQFSFSPTTLAKLFTLLVDDRKLRLDNILVLGSGIGSVTFCTHLFVKDCKKIISCEWAPDQCELQRRVVEKHGMGDKVTVCTGLLPGDVGIIKSMDLVILCERVLSADDKQRETIFTTLRNSMKSGAILILYKRLEDYLLLFASGDKEELGEECKMHNYSQFVNWLVLEHELDFMNGEHCYYHVYKVL
ncbi:uncharacterized protein LOC110850656 isoform X2 [Folsomia candida]|uniref:Uncharacterized protein n=2 Tax=Folsomia candida TaxID=158441 RepID=A0A226E5B2_FOLCA|nr:uncharacterized protein LOC110850656 isoform X2 [Folsomia candida]XP_021953832.1 uncharacterized protein LOC110850656 isoform X2 [Folsomia candida]XP_021953833.1 uncharacterized protein LOC110850656 isoform X2 [Folsomia candida]OXA52488.1 hypothetical protein Fcan01_12158 [Folsomia candida]